VSNGTSPALIEEFDLPVQSTPEPLSTIDADVGSVPIEAISFELSCADAGVLQAVDCIVNGSFEWAFVDWTVLSGQTGVQPERFWPDNAELSFVPEEPGSYTVEVLACSVVDECVVATAQVLVRTRSVPIPTILCSTGAADVTCRSLVEGVTVTDWRWSLRENEIEIASSTEDTLIWSASDQGAYEIELTVCSVLGCAAETFNWTVDR